MSKDSFQQILQDQSPEIQQLARSTRDLVLSVRPNAITEVETSWGGYLLFKPPVEGGNTVCFVSAHSKHVSLGFALGAQLEDPQGLLQGKGKLQRHVKLKKPADVDSKELKDLLEQAWSLQPEDAVVQESLNKLRELCLSLPKTSETVSHGHPTFKVGKKSFAVYGIYSPSVAFKADVSLHAELDGDDRIFPTPYMANKGWLSVRLDSETDWSEVERFLKHSYSVV